MIIDIIKYIMKRSLMVSLLYFYKEILIFCTDELMIHSDHNEKYKKLYNNYIDLIQLLK